MRKSILLYIILMLVFSIYFYFSDNHAITQFGYYGESNEWKAVVLNVKKDGQVNYDKESRNLGKSVVIVEYIGDVNKYADKEVNFEINVGGSVRGIGEALFQDMLDEGFNNKKAKGKYAFRFNHSGYDKPIRFEDKVYFTFKVNGEVVEELRIDQPIIKEITINDYYKHSAFWNRLYRKYYNKLF